MKNFNEYDPVKFKSDFQNTELYNKIVENADIILWEKFMSESENSLKIYTPRERHFSKIVTLVPFYYLQFLTEVNPSNIYDIGCGMNYFKKFIPSIIGIDAKTNNGKIIGDIYGCFDEKFVLRNRFDSAFAINSLHFVSLIKLRHRILEFVQVINTAGRGFLTFNSAMLLYSTPKAELKIIFPNGMTVELLDEYVRTQFDNIDNIEVLCFDSDLTLQSGDWMNGNIRVVFEKNN